MTASINRPDVGRAAQAGVEAYLVHCDAQGLAKSTRARRLSAIKQLYRFAFEEGWRSDNPAIRIAGPGRDKRLPKTLSIAEVDALLDAARAVGTTRKALRELVGWAGRRRPRRRHRSVEQYCPCPRQRW